MKRALKTETVETLPVGNNQILAEAVSKLVMALPEGFAGKLLTDLATVASHKKVSMQDALLLVVSNAASNIGKPVYSFLS